MPVAGPAAAALLRSMAGTAEQKVTIVKQHETQHYVSYEVQCARAKWGKKMHNVKEFLLCSANTFKVYGMITN
jgi:hypothetical protein